MANCVRNASDHYQQIVQRTVQNPMHTAEHFSFLATLFCDYIANHPAHCIGCQFQPIVPLRQFPQIHAVLTEISDKLTPLFIGVYSMEFERTLGFQRRQQNNNYQYMFQEIQEVRKFFGNGKFNRNKQMDLSGQRLSVFVDRNRVFGLSTVYNLTGISTKSTKVIVITEHGLVPSELGTLTRSLRPIRDAEV